MRVIKSMPDPSTLQTIQVIEIIAAPLITGALTALGFYVQRKREAATARKIISEGVNVDADTDSKYGANYLKWTQEFRAQLEKTNDKLTQTQTDLMRVTSELAEMKIAKITLELNYKDLQSKFDIIERQKIQQDSVIESQRIEIVRLTEEVRKLKEAKPKRGKNARSTNQSA